MQETATAAGLNFELSEEQKAVRDAARDFAQNVLKPGVIERDRDQKFPAAEIKQLGELGFLGMMVSSEYGGGGMDTISYVLAMEDKGEKGKALRTSHIADAIVDTVAPLERPKSNPEARFRQMHRALKNSYESGFRHVLIIEEAHSMPISTLKHLKRMRELESGFTKLVSIILIGQTELMVKLSERNAEVREVVQRIEVAELLPVSAARLDEFLAFRLARVGKKLEDVIDTSGVQAIAERLSKSGRDSQRSLLYPLAIGNMMVAAMNLAVRIGEPVVTADVIKEV